MTTNQKNNVTLPIVSGICIGVAGGLLVDEPFYRVGFLQVVLFGMLSALNSFFLEFCYQEGNIFGWWIKFIDKHIRDNPRSPFRELYKPLGGCIYCQNIWVAIAYFMVGHFYFEVSWWLMLPTMLFSHFILTLLDLTFWRNEN